MRALIANHLDPATKDFNLDPLRGTDVDAETLASVLATPPMMAEWRCVVLREVEGLASGKQRARSLDEGGRLPSARTRSHHERDRPPRFPCEVLQWSWQEQPSPWNSRSSVKRMFQGGLWTARGRCIPSSSRIAAAQALGAAIGTNLGVLSQELEKLAGFVGDAAVVTVADVEAAGTKLPTHGPMALVRHGRRSEIQGRRRRPWDPYGAGGVGR